MQVRREERLLPLPGATPEEKRTPIIEDDWLRWVYVLYLGLLLVAYIIVFLLGVRGLVGEKEDPDQ